MKIIFARYDLTSPEKNSETGWLMREKKFHIKPEASLVLLPSSLKKLRRGYYAAEDIT